MANILIIGGWQMSPPGWSSPASLGDGSAYWTLADRFPGHNVRTRSCGPHNADADVLWADAIIAYSYGMARLHATLHFLAAKNVPAKRYKMVTCLAGVPDAWMLQFYGSLWHIPPSVDRAMCLQINAIPESCPISDTASVALFWEERDRARDCKRANIYCDSLVSGLPPIDKHTRIKELPEVLHFISCEVGAACAGVASV